MRRTARILSLLGSLAPLAGLLAQPPDSLWSRTYGGEGTDICQDVQQTPDGGFVFAGTKWVDATNSWDFWLFRTDANGDSLWSRTYGDSCSEYAYCLQQTSDGGYVLAGTLGSDWRLLRTDAEGDSQWARSYGTPTGWDICYTVKQTSDGGYILGGMIGYTFEHAGTCWLLKTDANGDSLWSREFGGGFGEECDDVEQTSDGGYVLGATTCTYGAGLTDFWLIKTDANGDSEWTRTFGGYYMDMCRGVEQTLDGGYVLAGETWSFGAGGGDFWLVKMDASGDSQWSRTYGTEAIELCNSLQQTSDGGYVLAGERTAWIQDFWLLRADPHGDSLWSLKFGGEGVEVCYSVRQTSDEGFILGGGTDTCTTFAGDAWLVRVGPELSVGERPVARDFCVLTNHPNPFNAVTTLDFVLPRPSRVSIRAYDVLGRDVGTISNAFYPSGRHTILWQCPTCASGTYWISMTGDGFHFVRKAILLR